MRVFTLLILLTTSIIVTAQEKPTAVMIDEFGKTGCEDMQVRVENFLASLQRNPQSRGYVVMYPQEGINIRGYFKLEQLLRSSLIFLRFQNAPVTFVRAARMPEQKVELWIAPSGAEPPKVSELDWTREITTAEKYFDSSWPYGELCAEDPVDMFAVILKDGPTLRGHISISERSDRKYRKLLGEIKTKLASVDALRLRFFRRRDCSADTCGRYQLWLVPGR